MAEKRRFNWPSRLAAIRSFYLNHRSVIDTTAAVLVLVIFAQLVYPSDKALPMAKLDGQSIGWQSQTDIAKLLDQRYDKAEIITDNPVSKTSFADAGVIIDEQASAETATDYVWWQRLIPFSSIWAMYHQSTEVIASYSPPVLSQWAHSLAKKCQQEAEDARITVKDDDLELVKSRPGRSCQADKLVANLMQADLTPETKLSTGAVSVAPKRSDQAVQAQISSLKVAVKDGLTLEVNGVKTTADKAEIISWLDFKDGQNGSLLLDIDARAVEPFLARAEKPIYVAPGVTTVYLRDGKETHRTTGMTGQGVDRAKTIAAIRDHLRQQAQTSVTAATAALPPTVNYQRSYSYTQTGLQALIEAIAKSHPDMAISIWQLEGPGWTASYHGTQQYHPASTYKLVVAVTVMQKIETGQLKWSDQVNGVTADQCLTRMIVQSDNACAEAFGEKFGWGTIQSTASSIGMSHTNLNTANFVSCTDDQVKLLTKLEQGQLMNKADHDKLINLMKSQVFRQGIPAGTSSSVADKVGFLSGLLHDSAIVYQPNSKYAISIYSDKGSWADIAEAERQIAKLVGG